MKDLSDILREWKQRQSGSDFALATLVRAEGSSYRRPGARMLICEDGTTVGSLSAGCLEDEVALRAREVLETGRPALMSFDTRKRFGCAGKIDVFIESVPKEFFADLAETLDRRSSCLVITKFGCPVSGSHVVRSDYEQEHQPSVAAVTYGLASQQELIQEVHPPVRLVICGDGPDSAPFHSLGRLLGWQVIEIADPNSISIELFAAGPAGGGPDHWTAALVKSHNYGRDFAALKHLLPMNLRYVGLIGPRKRRDQLMNDLLDFGVTIHAGFFAPAGLDLGAETPQEIALAVVSEIQRVFSSGSGTSLRERKMSIHSAQKSDVLSCTG